jgi:hypothetical protein
MMSDERRARWERRAVRGYVADITLSAPALVIAGLMAGRRTDAAVVERQKKGAHGGNVVSPMSLRDRRAKGKRAGRSA